MDFSEDGVHGSSGVELDLFEDPLRMRQVEKMIPSMRPMHDEMRRKSSIRRETTTALGSLRIELMQWCRALIERTCHVVVREERGKMQQPMTGRI